MWPQGARMLSTTLVQQMAHSNPKSINFSSFFTLSASSVAFARAAFAARTSSDTRKAFFDVDVSACIVAENKQHVSLDV